MLKCTVITYAFSTSALASVSTQVECTWLVITRETHGL